MMLDFLNHYSKAISLDGERFENTFPDGSQKSDFLLFEETTICEFKDLLNFDVQKRVERVAKKGTRSEQDLKRDLYNTIENALSTANKQIKETKEILQLPMALGLVVIENHIPNDISVLALMDAANRKMMNGVDNVDGVLCLDFINTFVSADGEHIQPVQIVIRDTTRSKDLSNLVGKLMEDFSVSRNSPLHRNFDICKADQMWAVKSDGQYGKFGASLSINNNDDFSPKDR
ncbi:MAG: hypothetical protein P1P93_03750 [Gammaproteobacteria bacterium]|nr:hypothetical protein [Gammaproteobacteria bacterium]